MRMDEKRIPHQDQFFLQLRNDWMCPAVRILQHIPNLHIQLVKNTPEDGPVRSETCGADIRDE